MLYEDHNQHSLAGPKTRFGSDQRGYLPFWRQDPTFLVLYDEGQRKTFQDVSTVFANPSIGREEEYLSVYAPLDDLSRKQREEKKNRYMPKIRDIVFNNL